MFCVNCKANKLKKSGGVGYTEDNREYLLKNQSLVFDENGVCSFENELNIVEGEKYTVIWDGVEYECVGSAYGVTNVYVYIGNLSLEVETYPGNGEPFVFFNYYTGNERKWEKACAYTEKMEASTRSVSIYTGDETVHPIDPEFLPEGGVGYVTLEPKAITDKSEVVFEYMANRNTYVGMLYVNLSVLSVLSEGKTAIVDWDGKTYKCPVVKVGSATAFGNLAIVGKGDDTGEPFIVQCVSSGDPRFSFNTFSDAATHTIQIFEEVEVVHTIDPKFIPNVTPVVELTTALSLTDVGQTELDLTADESAVLTQAAKTGMPVIVKCTFNGATLCASYNNMCVFDIYNLTTVVIVEGAHMSVVLGNSSGAWKATVTVVNLSG